MKDSVTVRDWFASMIVSEMHANAPDGTPFDAIARKCYLFADAMMRARKEVPESGNPGDEE